MGSQQRGDQPSTEGTNVPRNDPTGKEEKKRVILRQARHTVVLLLEAIEKERVNLPTRDSGANISKNALKAFSSSETVSVEKFVSSGGLKSILSAIDRYSSSSDVVSSGCDTIAALTILDNGVIVEISKTRGVDVIVKAVSSFAESGSDDARVAAMKILRNLTQSEESRQAIFKAGGLEGVIENMRHSGENPRTLSHAALVLSNLAFGSSEIKAAVGELGGIKAIVEAMRKYSHFQGMQARGCLALRNLCYGCEDNQSVAGDVGATAVLLKTILMYKDDREVVHQSCVALINLSSSSVANRGRIVEAGGAKVAVMLMEMYESSLTVHDDALCIIRNICVESADARTEVGACGGVARIMEALQKFSDGKLMEKACSAIRYLCFLEENRERVREEGGMEKLVSVLKRFVNELGVVENGLLAIGNATFENEENKARIGRCGGILTVIKAIEQHRLCERVQEHGCRVLRNLVDGYEINARLLAENGGINLGVFAMMGYPDCASVQEQACGMLLNIVRFEDYVKKVEQADVRRLAEKAISMHGKNRGVLLQAGTLIDRLNGHHIGVLEEDRDTTTPKLTLVRKLTKKLSHVGSR